MRALAQKAAKACYDAYERSLRYNKDNILTLNNYAYFLSLDSVALERALVMSSRVVELTGSNPTYLDTHAWVLFKLGRTDEAKRIMQQAIALDGQKSTELLVHYGDILFALKEYFLAETYWRKALEKLKEQKPILQGYVMDEIYNKMENGSAGIAAYYAGDYLAMYENNSDLEFFYPEEGTNLYVDAMCIPKSSKNKELAERYINFMLTEEPAIANAEYTYYASPNRLVVESEEYIEYMGEIKEDAYEKMYDTDAVMTSTYKNLSGEKLVLINQLWEELKSDIEISAGIYAICGVIIAVLVSLFAYFGIRNKIRNSY